MLVLGKSGEGAYTWDRNISVWRPLPTVECHVGVICVLSLAVWLSKLEKNNEVRHNMTLIAILLVVATVFIGVATYTASTAVAVPHFGPRSSHQLWHNSQISSSVTNIITDDR